MNLGLITESVNIHMEGSFDCQLHKKIETEIQSFIEKNCNEVNSNVACKDGSLLLLVDVVREIGVGPSKEPGELAWQVFVDWGGQIVGAIAVVFLGFVLASKKKRKARGEPQSITNHQDFEILEASHKLGNFGGNRAESLAESLGTQLMKEPDFRRMLNDCGEISITIEITSSLKSPDGHEFNNAAKISITDQDGEARTSLE